MMALCLKMELHCANEYDDLKFVLFSLFSILLSELGTLSIKNQLLERITR